MSQLEQDYRTQHYINNDRTVDKIDIYNVLVHLILHTNIPKEIILNKILIKIKIEVPHLNRVEIKLLPVKKTDSKIISMTTTDHRQDNETIHNSIQATHDRSITVIEVMTSGSKVTIVKTGTRKPTTGEAHHIKVCSPTEGRLERTKEATRLVNCLLHIQVTQRMKMDTKHAPMTLLVPRDSAGQPT